MVESYDTFVELCTSAQDIAIAFNASSDVDSLAAAASLYLAFQAQGKNVRLFASDIPVSDQRLAGIDQVATTFGHQNLVVSFDYSEEKVDKISYHIGEETGKFFLTIKPKKGVEPLDSKTVEFTYSGAEPDLIISVGVSDLEELGSVYLGYEEVYQNSTLVSLHEYETAFGSLKFTTDGVSSLSELVAVLMQQLSLPYSPEVATNLLLGIEEKTRGLHYGVITAETFALVADLLRAGGQRMWVPVREVAPAIPTSEKVIETKVSTKKSKPKSAKAKADSKNPNEMTVSVSRR